MSQLKERDEQEALKQDEFFKRTLTSVRPFILNLTSAEDAQLCKIWLDKLSLSSSQRSLRNDYLLELYQQLKRGHVGGVFSKPPPVGSLSPLPKSYRMVYISSSLSDVSESSASYQKWEETNKHTKRTYPQSITSRVQCDTNSTSTSHCVRTIKPSSSDQFYDEEEIIDKSRFRIHRHHIDTLIATIKELRKQNKHLHQELLEYQEINATNENLHSNVRQLTSEITALKAKLLEVQKVKDVLESTHKETIQQYKNKVAEQFSKLKFQLHESECKNETLNNNILTMSQELDKIIHEKEEEIGAIKKQSTDKSESMRQQFEMLLKVKDLEITTQADLIRQKDQELLKKDQEGNKKIELLTNKIQDMENKLETQMKDENKLRAMLADQNVLMKQEFDKMRSEMELVSQNKNGNLLSKMIILKKTILKLQNSKEKLAYCYEKKISHILKNKDLEIKSLHIQLQGQKTDLCTSMYSERQCELTSLVDSLEEKYKQLLAKANVTAEEQHQDYLKKMNMLEDELSQLKKKFQINEQQA
ncbi:hypothetical protein KPH14_005705 [Odynerus spinipes]|uniref:DUF4485 domain-containing protein n=1 Tax=Odynerus spinipes TaxID=1348599 RepID=A0AAD9VIY5_9HYME|nr:hypothetical protein KPH14_005705 [Odynerus spinipes]